MEMPLKQTLLSAANAIEAAAAFALSNAQRALSDAERHAAFAKDAVAKIKAAQEAEEMPSAVLDVSVSELSSCDVCGLPCRGGASAQGFCGPCAYEYDSALKKHPEEFADAMLEGPDALRLLILRLSAETIRDDEELHDVYYCGAGSPGPMEKLLNTRAADLLERLPASFAPWWKQRWTYEKSCEMKAARKAVDWALASADAPLVQRLAAMFVAEQAKLKEMEARHQLALEEAWEAGAAQGVQDTEDVMKDKLEELEAEHKKQMAGVTEASAEASNAVGEAAEKIRHDAKRRGYADGYAFADQKWTPVYKAVCEDLEAVRRQLREEEEGATTIFQGMRADLERLSAENKALRTKLDAEVAAAADDIYRAMRSDLEEVRAENKALRQQIEEDKQMVQRHLKEVAKGHAEATAWEKEEIERLRKNVRAHEARVAWHADMAKRDMEENVAKIRGLEAQVAEHSRWRDEANHAASVAELEAKKLRANLAEADWEKEQLLKAVQALRELVGPTKKLMASNPELFGGEARGTSSPRPPAIVRLPPIKEEDTERALNLLKGLLAPTRLCGVVESSSPLPGIVEAEPSTEALFMALTEAQYQEMLNAGAASPLSSSPPPTPILVPDHPTVCAAGGYIECPPAEPEAEQTRICCRGCGKPKPDYNNPRWPSPRAKRFAKHIATHSGKDAKTIKTHEDALQFLAQRANISVEALLKMSEHDYQVAHASWTCLGNGTAFYTGVRSTPWWR